MEGERNRVNCKRIFLIKYIMCLGFAAIMLVGCQKADATETNSAKEEATTETMATIEYSMETQEEAFAEASSIEKTEQILEFEKNDTSEEKEELLQNEDRVLGCGTRPPVIVVSQYGTLENITATAKCPHCGEVLNKRYVETFVLDPSYSDKADIINSALKAKTDARVAATIESKNDVSSDTCGEHSLYFMIESTGNYISDVQILEGRYLAISEDSVWYGTEGPNERFRSQYLFDLETGDELTFRNFYKGTDENLRTIIATKVKDDFKDYSTKNNIAFSENDLNEAYECAYKNVKLETARLKEDGVIFYLHYYDFVKNPYEDEYYDVLDDTFFEVKLGYEELK